MAALRIAAPQPPAATDGLWEHTCFEAFVAVAGSPDYLEFNFAPSGLWAAYAFSAYRQRRAWTASQAPMISTQQTPQQLSVTARIAAADMPPLAPGQHLEMGLTTVIETMDGKRSYWALQHPDGRPDFHNREGFISL